LLLFHQPPVRELLGIVLDTSLCHSVSPLVCDGAELLNPEWMPMLALFSSMRLNR
jgi:hypothetical protein